MARPQEMPRLEPEQQKLLLAALNSQRQKDQLSQQKNGNNVDPSVLNPFAADKPLASMTFDDSFDFGGTGNGNSALDDLYLKEADDFTASFQELDGDAGGEKRKSPEEDDEDDEGEDGDGKGDERAAKKPGRKLLTNEPTTKRKAQNRAAQRAFRERKEKHLKDLESKVSDLEQASEAANHENGILRAQIERLTTEVREYRKRASMNGSINSSPPRFDSFSPQNNNGFDFNFDIPNFSGFQSSSMPRGSSNQQGNRSNSWDAARNHALNNSQSNGASPLNGGTPHHANTFSSFSPGNRQDTLGGIFSPKDLDSLGDFGLGGQTTGSPASLLNGRASSYSSKQSHTSPSNSGSAGSPPSSLSNTGGESSCTSPDAVDSWATNYTTSTSGFGEKSKQTPQTTTDGGFDWLNLADGSDFDPLLFGSYREPQEAIVGNGTDFTSGFFEDPVSNGMFDVNDPFFNLATDTTVPAIAHAPSPADMRQNAQSGQKESNDLMEQVRKQRDGDDSSPKASRAFDSSTNSKELMTCHKIWNQLQNCPQFKSGEFDIDSLCSELASKARCTETGVAVPKHYVEQALWRLANPDQNGNGNASTSSTGQSEESSSRGKGGLSAMFPGLA